MRGMRKKLAPLALVAITGLAGMAIPGGAAGAAEQGSPDRTLQAEPFEVRALAEDRGISYDDAAERLSWQERAVGLRGRIATSLGPNAFGGMWIDVQDGDRFKLATTPSTSEEARSRARAVLQSAQLEEHTDWVNVEQPVSALQATVQQMTPHLARANNRVQGAYAIALNEPANAVQVLVDKSVSTDGPEGKELVERARTRGLEVRRGQAVESDEEGCNSAGHLRCDPSARGGVEFATAEIGGCTLGFLAQSRSDSTRYFATAGHCFPSGNAIGVTGFPVVGSASLGVMHNKHQGQYGDMAIIRLTNENFWNSLPIVAVLDRADTDLDLTYYINNDDYPYIGTRICYTGSWSRNSDCGETTSQYVVEGGDTLMVGSYCGTTGGDSGGPLYGNHTAWGLHRGAIDSCSKYFTPITSVENTMNVDIVHGVY